MIYIVEDDANIRELICYTLSSMSMPSTGFKDGQAFLEALNNEKPELVIMDLMLPGTNGLELIRLLRKKPELIALPILILSAKDSEFDKVVGLNTGGDDYLTKPFGAMELVARVKALIRRKHHWENYLSNEEKNRIQFGKLHYDKEAREFFLNEERMLLTNKEFTLLRLFVENPNTAFSRDQLLDVIWGYGYNGESRTVDVHVASLRQKLEEMGSQIETIRSYGYRFNPLDKKVIS